MAREIGIVRSIADFNFRDLTDDFLGAGVADGAIGVLGWRETNSAAGTNAVQAGAVDHPGIIRLVTGATSTNNKRLHLGTTASEATFTPTSVERFRFVCRIPTITTLTVRLGLMQDISAASGGTAAAIFQFDPAVNAAWQVFTRQGGTGASVANGPSVVASNWYQLEAIRLTSGNWQFWINGSLVGTSSANNPTTACAFGVLCQTGTAAARNVDLDYCSVRSAVGQLWT